MAIDVKTFVN